MTEPAKKPAKKAAKKTAKKAAKKATAPAPVVETTPDVEQGPGDTGLPKGDTEGVGFPKGDVEGMGFPEDFEGYPPVVEGVRPITQNPAFDPTIDNEEDFE